MLYVFHVDVGRMLSFDMSVALSSVENLKESIERVYGIPAINIVLLVSGGEVLTPSTQVAYYSSGTDTNPIYMFLTGDPRTPPPPAIEPNRDLGEQVERCKQLQPIYSSVEKRAKLAQKLLEYSIDEQKLCIRLVFDQHLQQQGWSAVVANMEDLIQEFRLRFTNFSAAFDRHLERRNGYLELLHNFNDDLIILGRIPILPGLMPMAEEDFHGFDDYFAPDEVFSRSQSTQKSVLVAGGVPAQQTESSEQSENVTTHSDLTAIANEENSESPIEQRTKGTDTTEPATSIDTTTPTVATVNRHSSSGSSSRRTLNLLQWITSKETQNRLQVMCDECIQGLGTFDKDVYAQLKNELQHILKQAEQTDVREIKGLGERLCKLEEFKYQLKRLMQDQNELCTAFQQNQSRVNDLNDPSILPDLCDSHQSQLVVMVMNHNQIRDIRRIISKAKDELGINLHMRLNRIVHVENSMSEFDNRLLFYLRCLRRAERHIQIIEQIHQTPCIYMGAVTEVVRRKIFSGEFRRWATKFADDFELIRIEEIKIRQQFNEKFDGHFLSKLFPGMNEMPPSFANAIPLNFDARLPNITKLDIDLLSSHLPGLAPQTLLPDMEPVIKFFFSRSGAQQKERLEGLLRQQAPPILGTSAEAEDGVSVELSAGEKPLVSQRRGELQKPGDGCEGSETDTENEFEKLTATQSTAPTLVTTGTYTTIVETADCSVATDLLLTQNAETLTDESESSARAEVKRLHGILNAMHKLSSEFIRLSRADLEHCRTDVASYGEDLQSELQLLHDQWSLIRMQSEQREKVLLQTQELLNESAQQREDELAALRQKLHEAELLQPQLENLKEKLSSAELEQERAVAAAREELLHEHKSEIESLRCRYKLMTSMELSPSETSLEKLERPPSSIDQNTIDRSEHESIVAQLRATFDTEKEKAIAAALDVERAIWQTKLNLNSESVIGNVNILKEMLEEKDRQLDLVRKQNLLLTKEIYQLKLRIDSLTNEEGNSWLKEKIEYLNRDKNRLEEELTVEKERSKRLEMETSFAALKASSSSHKYLLLDSCNKGDVVFVVWSMRHSQYMIVQDSPILYFVHGDCLSAMNLRVPTSPSPSPSESESTTVENTLLPVPYYAIGRVTDREYCQAKKDENRYRVAKGTRFYRIKLMPLSSMQNLPGRREKIESSFCASTSTSFSRCDSSTDNESTALLPSGCKALVPVSGCTPASPTLRQPQFSPNISTIEESTAATTTTTTTSTKDVVDFISATSNTEATSEAMTRSAPTDDGDNAAATTSGERRRYTSFSIEEDTDNLPTLTSTPTSMRSMPSQQLMLQTVITEQPTSSAKQNVIPIITDPCIEAADVSGCSSDLKNASFATACSEDSDEYRSLEHKDDADFTVSE